MDPAINQAQTEPERTDRSRSRLGALAAFALAILRRVGLALATGYIFLFFAERMFWSFWRAKEDNTDAFLATWLVYSIAAEICLLAIRTYRVRDIRAVFVIGALMGWLVEGVFTMTIFGAEGIPYPVTIVWTGLAWHALIVVVIGWWGLQTALLTSFWRTALVSAGFGLFWGGWSIFWEHRPPPGQFSVHALLASAALVVALRMAHSCRCGTLRPSRIEAWILLGMVLAFFALVTVPYFPILAPITLPALFGLIWLALRRNRAAETAPDFLVTIDHPIPWSRMLAILPMPVLALLVHEGCQGSGLSAPTNLVVFFVTVPAGAICFGISVRWLLRREPSVASAASR